MAKRVLEDSDMNSAYPVQYEHEGYKWHGIVNDWEDMEHLTGLTVRYSPCNQRGQTMSHIVLEGILIKVEIPMDGDLEPVYLILKPYIAFHIGSSNYALPPQMQFLENTFDQFSIYFASNGDY